MEENDVLILTDDDGNESEMIILDEVLYKGKEYVILVPSEEDYEGPVVIMQRERENEYFFIDDRKIIEDVYALYMEESL